MNEEKVMLGEFQPLMGQLDSSLNYLEFIRLCIPCSIVGVIGSGYPIFFIIFGPYPFKVGS